MLQITIPAGELLDESTGNFIYTKEQTIQLEHSLVSLSKWESKWHKAFFSKRNKTDEEVLHYIQCMTLTKNVDPMAFHFLSADNITRINEYIENPMTAIVFFDDKNGSNNRETITSEIIYYMMIANNIPFECEKWHINRLLTLIRVCNIKNAPPKKMSKQELLSRNSALNASRKQKLNTKG